MKPNASPAFSILCWLTGLVAFIEIFVFGLGLYQHWHQSTLHAHTPVSPSPPLGLQAAAIPTSNPEVSLEEKARALGLEYEKIAADAIASIERETRKNQIQVSPPIEVPDKSDNPEQSAANQKVTQARVLRRKGDLIGALLILESSVEKYPEDAALHYELGLAYESLGNVSKARESYLKVYQFGSENAHQYFKKAFDKLEHGFEDIKRWQGLIGYGNIRPRFEESNNGTQELTLHLPVEVKPGTEIDVSDLELEVDFFDLVGQTKTEASLGQVVSKNWLHPPVDWKDGDEVLEIKWKLTNAAMAGIHLHNRRYYGFVARLFYKSEPMDAVASPRSLFMRRQTELQAEFPDLDTNFLEGGLLPPKENKDPIPQPESFNPDEWPAEPLVMPKDKP